MICPHCEFGYPKLLPDLAHYQVSERGIRRLGECLDPDPAPGQPKPDAASAKLHEKALALEAAAVLEKARVRTHMEHSQPREIGEDDGDDS